MKDTRTIPRPVELETIKKAVPMFFKGYPCSYIDKALKLDKGTAKDAVMTYWFSTLIRGQVKL